MAGRARFDHGNVAPNVTDYAEAAGAAYALASEQDFGTEWHGLEMSVAIVDDLDEALARAQRIPPVHHGAIEIRAVADIPGWDEAIGLVHGPGRE